MRRSSNASKFVLYYQKTPILSQRGVTVNVALDDTINNP
jgi:hypothetical protein